MLTIRENLLETIRGGSPDRYVNQYEYLVMIPDPTGKASMGSRPKGQSSKNGWGVTIEYPDHVPGPFPNTSPELVVVKDVARWRDYVTAPPVKFPEEEWASCMELASQVDRSEKFVAAMVAPGIFEKLHYLTGMEEAMIGFYEEPEAMHELVDYLTEYEIAAAKEVAVHIHPDAVFHHDDWGSQLSSFLSPEMFGEFLAPAYKKIYGFWREAGVELVVHHSDSYAANLVPQMIEMGIDIWQGGISTNNLPQLISRFGGQISFHGGINNGRVDVEDWTQELIDKEVEAVCRACGKRYFIPGLTAGGPGSTYPGVYQAATAAIERVNRLDS